MKKCSICDKEAKKKCITCCSPECITKQKQKTSLKLYGHVCSIHGDNKHKVKKTLLDRYGVENISQVPEVRDKKIETCRKNFGVDFPMQSPKVREKSKQVCLKKYGVPSASMSEEYKNIIYRNLFLIPRENGLTPFEQGLEKIKLSNLEKFGVPYYFESEEFKRKLIEMGLRSDPITWSEWEWYSKRVRALTKKNIKRCALCIENHRSMGKKGMTVDHNYSIYQAFLEGVSPEIISHPKNLEVVTGSENSIKGVKCSVTLENLKSKISKCHCELRIKENI